MRTVSDSVLVALELAFMGVQVCFLNGLPAQWGLAHGSWLRAANDPTWEVPA